MATFPKLSYCDPSTDSGRLWTHDAFVSDSNTRTIKVRFEFYNGEGELLPGMYTNIVIKTAERENTIVVPRKSVIHSGEMELVFVEV